MPRYIDADALLLKVQVESTEAASMDAKNEGFVVFCEGVRKIVEKSISEMPTVDVQEVKHGYWETCGVFDDFVRCSVCKEHKMPMLMLAAYKFNGCPNCLARMDGDEK